MFLLLALAVAGSARADTLVTFTNLWRYQQTTNLDGVAWMAPDFDDSAWPAGRGVLAREDCRCLPQPVNTTLETATNRITYYFRTRFANPNRWPAGRLVFTNLIDDGAVFYLNGVEIWRAGIRSGEVKYRTLASRRVDDATNYNIFAISGPALTNLLPGDNVLAVEVHQNSTNSSDIVFGTAVGMFAAPELDVVGPPDKARAAHGSQRLQVAVRDPDTRRLTVTFYGWFEETNAGPDFTIVVLPDTQFYSKTYSNIFVAQTDWIIANRERLNIVYVVHLGDITNDGDNQPYQWLNATNALYRLECPKLTGLPEGIPYGVTPGNHDHYGGTKLYNRYFGVERFAGRSYYGGHFGSDNQNHFDLFSAGGRDFVVVYTDYDGLNLDYWPLDIWANGVLAAHAHRRAIAVTHGILEVDGSYESDRAPSLYESLRGNANLFLMLCGHNHGEARRIEQFEDRAITICLSDYQSYTNGGNGFLRLYEFSPSNNVIRVKTFSPFTGEYWTRDKSQFEIPYDMSGMWRPFATNLNVASGKTTSTVWRGLKPGTEYRWFATASDGFITTRSQTRTFTTGPAGGFAREKNR